MTAVLAAFLLVVSQAPGDQDWARDPRPAAKEDSSKPVWKPNRVAVALGAAASATAIGLGACAWFARESDAGLGCTIVAGGLSLGLLFPLMIYGLIRAYAAESPKVDDGVIGAGFLLFHLCSVAGLVVGAVVAGFAAKEPGVQRGVVGLSASGIVLAEGIAVPFVFTF